VTSRSRAREYGGASRSKEPLWTLQWASGGGRLRADRTAGNVMTESCRGIGWGSLVRQRE